MSFAESEQFHGRVRPAVPADVEAILALVRALARYEHEPDAAEATPEQFHEALFGPDPRVHAHVAEVDADDGPVVAAIAVWFVTFSTWKGRHGLWLEDLFVMPEHRRLGLGRELFTALASVCVENGWSRFEWSVLDWNASAHRFYESLGAKPEDEWTTWRLDGPALDTLGHGLPDASVG